MMTASLWLDLVLALLILILAGRALTAPTLHQSVILFVAFGLTMALAWARLAAPDVALAEAAIGTGLLGVLLIDSLRVFSRPGAEKAVPVGRGLRRRIMEGLMINLGLMLAVVLTAAIWTQPVGGGLTELVAGTMEVSGVEHPVTAVLLNFRGYDTWLEVGVLLLAMWGIFCAGGRVGFKPMGKEPPPGLLLDGMVRGVAPLIVLVGGYLLWMGKTDPGGAFQAGVVLGAGGIFLRLIGIGFPVGLREWIWKGALMLGFGFFLLVGLGALGAGLAFLQYPRAGAGALILWVEIAATISIGFTLYCFFVYLYDSRGASEGSLSHDGN